MKNPITIIAEIASAHSGNLDKQIKLIDAASRTGADGADFVKMHQSVILEHLIPA